MRALWVSPPRMAHMPADLPRHLSARIVKVVALGAFQVIADHARNLGGNSALDKGGRDRAGSGHGQSRGQSQQ